MSITIPSPADFCSSYPVAVRNHLFLRFRETLCRFTQPFNTSLAFGDHDGPAVACDPFLPSKFQLSRLRIRGFRRVATSFQPGNLVFSDDLLSLKPWTFPARYLGNRSVITFTENFQGVPTSSTPFPSTDSATDISSSAPFPPVLVFDKIPATKEETSGTQAVIVRDVSPACGFRGLPGFKELYVFSALQPRHSQPDNPYGLTHGTRRTYSSRQDELSSNKTYG